MRFTSYMTEEARKEFLESPRFYYVKFNDNSLPKTVHLVNRRDVSVADDGKNGPEILLFSKPAKADVFNDIKEAREWATSETISRLKKLNQDETGDILALVDKIAEAKNRIKEREKIISELRNLTSK